MALLLVMVHEVMRSVLASTNIPPPSYMRMDGCRGECVAFGGYGVVLRSFNVGRGRDRFENTDKCAIQAFGMESV